VWVVYEGKPKIAMESADRAILQVRYSPLPRDGESGTTRSPRMPVKIGVDQLATIKEGLWGAMPPARKTILLGGLAGLVLLRLAIFIGGKKRKKPLGI
jgi:hypothetical protein